MASVEIWPLCFNLVSMVPLIQQILNYCSTMWSSMYNMPKYNRRKLHVMGRLVYLVNVLSNLNICALWKNTQWYLEQKQHQQIISVPIRTILHPCLDVFGVKDVQDIWWIFGIETHQYMCYRDIIYAKLTHIMTILLMTFCIDTKFIIK